MRASALGCAFSLCVGTAGCLGSFYETGHCDARRTVQRMDTVDGHAVDPLVAPIAGDTMKTLTWFFASKASDLTVETEVRDPIVATICDDDDSLGSLEVPVRFHIDRRWLLIKPMTPSFGSTRRVPCRT